MIISYGLPSGLQNSIISFANVIVQSNINSFGKMAVAGCGAYSKIEGFGFLPMYLLCHGTDNLYRTEPWGPKVRQSKKRRRFGIVCSVILAEVVGLCIYGPGTIIYCRL